MPLFKKSSDAQRQAELELQQSTLTMINTDAGASSRRSSQNTAGPWYTPTTINAVPYRNATPQTSASMSRASSPGFSPQASTTAGSRAGSRMPSRASTPSMSPPPVIVTPSTTNTRPVAEKTRFSFDNTNNRTSASPGLSTTQSTPAQKNTPNYGRSGPNYGRASPNYGRQSVQRSSTAVDNNTPRLSTTTPSRNNTSILSKILSIKVPSPRNLHISNPLKKFGKDEADVSKSRSTSSAGLISGKKGSTSSPWATNGATTGTVTVKTRDGEVSKSDTSSTSKSNQETKQIAVDKLTPNMRPRPVNVPKITRKIQTDPVDENFQLIKQEIIFAVMVLLLAVLIALAASANLGSDFRGAFASGLGDPCSYMCRPGTYSNDGSDTPLIVLALDGFRADYLETYKDDLPNLRRISECGVAADMRASFPATTAPNLWTIVSGYFPQFHGIVSEWILDYNTSEEFSPRFDPNGPGSTDAGWFHDEALWQIAREQGKITASHSWLGNNLGEVEDDHHPGETENRSPHYYKAFGNSHDYMTRMEEVLEWVNLPANRRPTFTTVYFEDPGETGRRYGTRNDHIRDVLKEIDDAIGYFFDQLMEQQIVDCINFMVVSTSGMVDTHCDRVYYLADDINYLNNYTLSPNYLGSMSRITPKASAPDEMDTEEEVIEYLQCKVDHGQAYLTDFLPSRLHGAYGHHLEEALVLMEDGWTFAQSQIAYNRYNCRGANDGYDPFSEDMMGIFVGFGKDFKIGQRLQPFQNTQLFSLMSDLIGVEPISSHPPSDGSRGYLNNALKKPGSNPALRWGIVGPSNDRCQFPDERRMPDDGCSCTEEALDVHSQTAGTNLTEKDSNLDRDETTALMDRNAPFGLPGVKDDINMDGEYFCILYQNNYITAYDYFLQIPLYVSFTISGSTGPVPILEECLRYDQRLEPAKSQRCDDYYNGVVNDILHIQPTFLYQPILAGNIDAEFDQLITSNLVPMYDEFANDVWKPVSRRIREWASEASDINVIAGPAYDMDRDSTKDRYFDIGASNFWVGDTPVPSHYFLVVTQCDTTTSLKDCPYDEIATKTFLFPHTNKLPNADCFNFDEYLMSNRATIQDVERMSGLAFFTDWSRESETQMHMLRFKHQIHDGNSDWAQL